MNSKATKAEENNENLCPLARKRLSSKDSTTQTPNWKLAKLESTSSPSALTNEYLEEMGIGMLDSEESSSSAASALALALTASTDENSNEATPNLDASKLVHQSKQIYHRMDSSLLDATTDNANNHSYLEPKDTTSSTLGKTLTEQHHHQHKLNINNNSNSSLSLEIFPSERLRSLLNSSEKFQVPSIALLSQRKKIAILGMGASSTVTSNTQTGNSGVKNSRSPLATVACNGFLRNVQIQQQQHQLQQHLHLKQASFENALLPPRSQSPQMLPSTSQQAALFEQNHQPQQPQQPQQHQHHHNHHQLQLLQQHQIQQQEEEQQRQPKQFLQQQQKLHQQKVNIACAQNFFLYRNQFMHGHNPNRKDYFNTLSDEIILQIFKLLPKKTLLRCGYVCRRFNRCASDESLWTRLDLGLRSIKRGGMENIVKRGVVILRLAQAQLHHPIFEQEFLELEPNFVSKLQYLDLSMVTVTKPSLKILLSRCRHLKKLSLEHVALNDEICNEIAKNTGIETLNLAMCSGLEAWSVRKIMECLQHLYSLNISWTNLSVDALTSLVTNISPSLMRLNVAGCRKTMFDSHLSSLAKRCPQLLELDLSDCTGLTGNAIGIISSFKMLEYLSLSRCYAIPATAYMQLRFMSTLTYLDIFGMLTDAAMEVLELNFSNIGINKFVNSSVARPTVGTRRTSIWGLRTRD